nr:synaptobrevin, longin-like domain protein [Tanacetum cinerariifolium]
MARLAFSDYHNMIAILEKYEHNTNFHQIVDFVEASHLRYALTINPTVYVSHIQQFWSTARIETMDEGTKILATVDGKPRTISESSIMRNLKLKDEAGISSLPDAELFENLTMMGYNILHNQKFSFQKGQFSHQWKYLIHTIIQCLSPKSTGFNEFSSNIATALMCLAINRVYNFSKMIFDGMVWNVNNKVSKFLMYPRARIAQSSALPTAADEPLLGMTIKDLEIATLKAKIKHLKDKDRGDDDPSGEDATIKGRRLETEEEAGIERSMEKGSDDIEEMVNVLTSLDAASVLSSGVQVSVPSAAEVATISVPPATISVSTGSDVVPTASPIFTTAIVTTPYSRRKEEEMAKDAQRMNEQIVRDAKIARIHAEEELQIMIDGLERNNETVAKYLQEYKQFAAELSIEERIELISDLVKYQDNYAKVLKYQIQQRKPLSKKEQKEFYMSVLRSHVGWKTRHFKGMSLEEIREKFIPVWKQIKDFVPMCSKQKRERFKRKGISLEQDSAKKVKTSEEVSKEDLKEMMQLVPVEEVYVEALQLWALVKETLSIRPAISDTEKELWVELKRLYEPDVENQL